MGRRATAEFFGTSLLLYAIVASGIVVQDLGNDPALQLFSHAVVVGAVLAALIALVGPVSGAHLNPAVTLVAWRSRDLTGRVAAMYVAAQTIGAVAGVVLAHSTFERAPVSMSSTARGGFGRALAEAVSTLVLVLLINGLTRANRTQAIPWAVGLWVAAAIFATSSTGFANPAVTLARSLTDTSTGIAIGDVPGFIVSQVGGALLAIAAIGYMFPIPTDRPAPREETLV
jgi:glycerol uptake facilitator-like aquaporin